MIKNGYFLVLQYLTIHPLILPLGIIGIWRWGVWTFKEVVARFYKPTKSNFKANISIVTPVYNENPLVFEKALLSWKQNNPYEIIAVIDYTDTICIDVFKKFAKETSNAYLIITRKAGKRPALSDGIRAAKGDIVALVDSDTLWGKDVIDNGIPPFIDPKVAGVGTYQNVYKPKSLAQKIFDIQLDLRYCDEMAFLGAAGDALVCLSGRTAFYRRKVILPMLPDLINETFRGVPVISGDDKRLTYLVLAAGWKVKYQNNSHVYTPGMERMREYLLQRLRWTRNSLRADIRALAEGWPLKHPALIFYQIDKVFQTFVAVISPIYFIIALATGLWVIAFIILAWWLVSRTIRLYPHLIRRPQDVAVLPVFILFWFASAIIRVYAFFTLNTQGWITRWDVSRLPRFRFLQRAPTYAATFISFLIIFMGVYYYKQHTYFLPRKAQASLVKSQLKKPSSDALKNKDSSFSQQEMKKDLLVKKYIVQEGDSLSGVAQKFGVSTENLLAANIARITNWNIIDPGFLLNIPGKDQNFDPQFRFNYQRVYPDILQTTYDPQSNTIIVTGRGHHVTLTDLKNSVGEKYIKEIAPQEWFLMANISVRSGVTLTLSNDEAKWIKLQSNKNKSVKIEGYNATITINGVKITSWDEDKNTYDTNIDHRRSYILAKNGSRMDIYNSELAYLGYSRSLSPETSPYGVSWRLRPENNSRTLLTGEVINSKFHHNYFGVYTFGATGMLWRGNEFYNNTRYGLDPHDNSNGALIENNISHHNGAHGFIISKRCMYNTFRNNISYGNKINGIMLHEKSDFNTLENNIVYDNSDGIVLWHSSNNRLVNNKIYRQAKNGIRANAASVGNVIANNNIYNSGRYGINLYDKANNNLIGRNTVNNNKTAIYVKTSDNYLISNIIHDNKIGIMLAKEAENNIIVKNSIYYHDDRGIATKLSPTMQNFIDENIFKYNKINIYAQRYPLTPLVSADE